MATLLELNTIEVNSGIDPGDPADPAIVAARDLRGKIRSAVLKRAGTILATPLPSDEVARGPALELLAWAQQAVMAPEGATVAVFRLALARAPGAASPAAILAATDQAIQDDITPVLALLAKGMHPG